MWRWGWGVTACTKRLSPHIVGQATGTHQAPRGCRSQARGCAFDVPVIVLNVSHQQAPLNCRSVTSCAVVRCAVLCCAVHAGGKSYKNSGPGHMLEDIANLKKSQA
jgi:hypothetical protein